MDVKFVCKGICESNKICANFICDKFLDKSQLQAKMRQQKIVFNKNEIFRVENTLSNIFVYDVWNQKIGLHNSHFSSYSCRKSAKRPAPNTEQCSINLT